MTPPKLAFFLKKHNPVMRCTLRKDYFRGTSEYCFCLFFFGGGVGEGGEGREREGIDLLHKLRIPRDNGQDTALFFCDFSP